MAGRWLLASFLALFLACQAKGDGGPPRVEGSYMASGEMVQTLQDAGNIQVQIAFEESADVDRQMAAFTVWLMGKNLTFVENFKTEQTFRYDGETCTLQTMEEWIQTESPPSLLSYEDTKGQVRFSLKQLFSLDDKYLKEKDVSDTFRGIPARKWMYEIRGKDAEAKKTHILSVYAYWSDGTWTTSNSDTQATPLGFIVTRMNMTAGKPGVKIHEQFINVFSFVKDAVDHKMFQPIQGVQCENRKQTLPFPDVNKIQAMAIHSEVIFPSNLEIRYVDMWFDAKNKMFRMDSEPIKDEDPDLSKLRKYDSEIFIGQLGVVFRGVNRKGVWSCDVTTLDKYEFDVQNLLNYRLPTKQWEVAKLFGLNETTYVYIGKAFKRDIPCHMFQGMRTDWPEPAAKVKSLWEWCFSENMTHKEDIITFKNGEYGLVHAEVRILESGSTLFYPQLRFMHHFYAANRKNPDEMQATSFDVRDCFSDSERRDLQFVVDWLITSDNIHLAENATSDVTFLQKWKSAIYRNADIEPSTLRVTKVGATVNDDKLYVRFSLLAPHKDLPAAIKNKQKSNFDAEQVIRDKINAGKMFISYLPDKDSKMLKLSVTKHSLDLQIKGDYKPHTFPTPDIDPTHLPTSTAFSLRTDPDEDRTTSSRKTPPTTTSARPPTGPTRRTPRPPGSSTAGPSVRPTQPDVRDRHSVAGHGSGTVASVSVAMLLVGVTAGAAGLFIYYNGLPKCSK